MVQQAPRRSKILTDSPQLARGRAAIQAKHGRTALALGERSGTRMASGSSARRRPRRSWPPRSSTRSSARTSRPSTCRRSSTPPQRRVRAAGSRAWDLPW